MNYNEYIKIQNLINIYDFYGESFLKNEGGDDMWAGRTRCLLNAMCELANDNKYPISSDLPDLMDFVDNNTNAKKLNDYVYNLPGFQPSLGKNQTPGLYTQHGFVAMGLHNLRTRNLKYFNGECEFKLNGKYRLRQDQTGIYLNIEFDDFSLKLEKRNEFLEKTFRINNVLVDNLTFHELINMITYASAVKSISKENTQAAHFFLG